MNALARAVARTSPEVRKPLLIYVNVPFCNSKCHFCDWVAQVPVSELRLTSTDSPRQHYIEALRAQLRSYAPLLGAAGYVPRIVYFGGGTASILTEAEMARVLEVLSGEFDLSEVAEATIEGSPESFTDEKLPLLRQAGFDRISIGVQSFRDERLRRIGRSHSADQAFQCVRSAKAAGFDNINIDLIVGFPGEQLAEVQETIQTARSVPANHFSVYPYRASPGTVLRKQVDRGAAWPSRDEQLAAYTHARHLLGASGSPEYAMSYFGSPRCQSDDAYYRLTMDWVGFGAGANSLLGGRYLSTRKGRLAAFNADPTAVDEDVPAASPGLTAHFLSQALTTPEGMSARLFEERTGVPLRTACQAPAPLDFLRRVKSHGRLLVDRTGIRIPREDMAATYVALSWIDLAATA